MYRENDDCKTQKENRGFIDLGGLVITRQITQICSRSRPHTCQRREHYVTFMSHQIVYSPIIRLALLMVAAPAKAGIRQAAPAPALPRAATTASTRIQTTTAANLWSSRISNRATASFGCQATRRDAPPAANAQITDIRPRATALVGYSIARKVTSISGTSPKSKCVGSSRKCYKQQCQRDEPEHGGEMRPTPWCFLP